MTNIFVGNLSYDATDRDLRSTFERYGHVSSAQVITDRGTGKSRGFGFVRMPNLDDADEAIPRLNGASICGRRIAVNVANDRDESPEVQAPAVPNLLDLVANA